MKGLMVSLIIVIFAGMPSNTVMASQQVGQEAAGLMPRLHPIPAFERPGPDDSTDDVAWPAPTSLLSRNSTVTSRSNQSGSQPFAAPTPDRTTNNNIRFDVKVDSNAIELLRQGGKVFSPVDVKDETTNADLPPSVVNKIALFHGANAGKNLQGIRLQPQPMERGSNTLRFEIPEEQLDRIEKDAFLFSVPEQLRGQFDRVEFVAASNLSVQNGSQGFPSGLGSTSGFDRWQNTNSPRPGPKFEPGGSEFTGPYIDPRVLESRRDQVAPIDEFRSFSQRDSFPQRRDFDRSPLDTNGGFQTAEREPEVRSKPSPFGRSWERPENNQNTFNDRQANQQDVFSQRDAIQRNNQALAEQQLRKELADAKAARERLEQDARDLQRQADLIAQQRIELNDQWRLASTRPVDFRQPTNSMRSDRMIDTIADVANPYGSQRADFQRQESTINKMRQIELDQQHEINDLKSKTRELQDDFARQIRGLQSRLNGGWELPERGGPADDRIHHSGFVRTADARNRVNQDSERLATGSPLKDFARQNRPGDRSTDGRVGGRRQEQTPIKSSSSDLIWLVPLLLGSLGLNLYLWIHCRSLYMRYTDLADELRDMVGASTG